jgi:hypothetical protein
MEQGGILDMSRERITAKTLTASEEMDADKQAFGQSANDYWMDRAKNAVRSALSEVERELREQAQKVTNEEAQELGVQPARYAKSEKDKEDVRMAMVFEPRQKKASEESNEMVFEPRQKQAGAPVDPSAIGKENWFQVQEKFPQYSKQKKLTMLSVAPTKRNMEAVSAVTDTLDEIASSLEDNGDTEGATQIDVISDLLTASVQECQRIANAKKEEK